MLKKQSMVGVWIDRDIGDIFSMCCAYNQTTKAATLKTLVRDYISTQPCIGEMIDTVAHRLYENLIYPIPTKKQKREIAWPDQMLEIKRKYARIIPPEMVDNLILAIERLRKEAISVGPKK